jgi:hypothetical protein
MSKVSISGDQNGTGNFTIKAPNSNVDRTLNLPDEAGTVLTNVSDIETQVKTATNATGSAPVYACRAWVNFDGTGTVSIRDSGNVSSITDRGTGEYEMNFATSMPDNDYSAVASCTGLNNGGNVSLNSRFDGSTDRYLTNSVGIGCRGNDSSNVSDPVIVTISVFR